GNVDRRSADRAGGQLVIERARKDPRGRGLANPADPGENPGLRNAARFERIRDRAHHRVLADEIVERRRAVFARQHAIGGGRGGGVVHWCAWMRGSRPAHEGEEMMIGGRLTSDPNRSSLGLLPSGPDPVGEWLVHRQPPASYIGGTEREGKPAAPPHVSFRGLLLERGPMPPDPASHWSLDPRLARDTVVLGDFALSP